MTTKDTSTTWFLAQLKPNSFKIAQTNLQRQGFETFLPLEEVTRTYNGTFRNVTRPLFPGYIFVALDVTEGLWRKVNATTGITKLVSTANMPTPVPSEIITHLRSRTDDTDMLQPQETLATGDLVTFKKGPFASFIAEIESIEPDRRVWVLIELMGRKTRISTSPEQLSSI